MTPSRWLGLLACLLFSACSGSSPGGSTSSSGASGGTSGGGTESTGTSGTGATSGTSGTGSTTRGTSSGGSTGSTAGLTISAPLKVDSSWVWIGQTLHASITYANVGTASVTLPHIVITTRPPGGTHANGPYDDLAPQLQNVRIDPGQHVTLEASRTFAAPDPTGTWEAYSTYEDGAGSWHESPSLSLVVQANHTADAGWTLTWSDEFNGPDGGAVDGSKWTPEVGGGGWGNQELEYYSASTSNARQQGGMLVIQANKGDVAGKSCWYGACQYSSARLITKGHFSQRYGRFEALIQIPAGQGIWPAFWLLGDDIDRVGWPKCGENDVMENIGREPTLVHGTLHDLQSDGSGDSSLGASYALAGNPTFAAGFHLFATEWDASEIRFYVDDQLYETRTAAQVAAAGGTWVFDHPFFMLLNVAVGGSWPGSPDATTVFPQQMRVDYVRVYQR